MISQLEKEVTLRYLKTRKKDGFLNVISIFSFIGISLGVAVLIIVMSVMNGFRTELVNKILGFNSHIVIEAYSKELNLSDLLNKKKNTLFKEFVKIGVFRGIFRCSDFNCRNVLVGLEDQFSPQYLVSIDEGDIGKRLDILGGRERWIINGLNADKTIINEILVELSYQASVIMCLEKMEK